MATAAKVLAVLAAAGAFASWIAGAVFYLRSLREIGRASRMSAWLAVAVWPFALRRLHGAAVTTAAKVNKALVALLVCLLVGGVSISLATNLSRLSR
jgi:hypothetical protein